VLSLNSLKPKYVLGAADTSNLPVLPHASKKINECFYKLYMTRKPAAKKKDAILVYSSKAEELASTSAS
jgi:hypothetical protein